MLVNTVADSVGLKSLIPAGLVSGVLFFSDKRGRLFQQDCRATLFRVVICEIFEMPPSNCAIATSYAPWSTGDDVNKDLYNQQRLLSQVSFLYNFYVKKLILGKC